MSEEKKCFEDLRVEEKIERITKKPESNIQKIKGLCDLCHDQTCEEVLPVVDETLELIERCPKDCIYKRETKEVYREILNKHRPFFTDCSLFRYSIDDCKGRCFR